MASEPVVSTSNTGNAFEGSGAIPILRVACAVLGGGSRRKELPSSFNRKAQDLTNVVGETPRQIRTSLRHICTSLKGLKMLSRALKIAKRARNHLRGLNAAALSRARCRPPPLVAAWPCQCHGTASCCAADCLAAPLRLFEPEDRFPALSSYQIALETDGDVSRGLHTVWVQHLSCKAVCCSVWVQHLSCKAVCCSVLQRS
mmetsp:Transcript_5554/g.10022  ORF Transcript_5554/g.10022 Transcript_5554/m.10022 type:complete len:201 (-) Transcript_5554:2159-2761(-)